MIGFISKALKGNFDEKCFKYAFYLYIKTIYYSYL